MWWFFEDQRTAANLLPNTLVCLPYITYFNTWRKNNFVLEAIQKSSVIDGNLSLKQKTLDSVRKCSIFTANKCKKTERKRNTKDCLIHQKNSYKTFMESPHNKNESWSKRTANFFLWHLLFCEIEQFFIGKKPNAEVKIVENNTNSKREQKIVPSLNLRGHSNTTCIN